MFDRNSGRRFSAALFFVAISVDLFAAVSEPGTDVVSQTPPATEVAATDTAELRSNQIAALFESGNAAEARKKSQEWLKAEKKSAWAWLTAARVAYLDRKFKRALSCCDEALERSPEMAEAYFWRGRSLESLQKPLEAANEYRAATLAKKPFAEAEEALTRLSAQLEADSRLSNSP